MKKFEGMTEIECLWEDFWQSVRACTDREFASPTHRNQCVEEAHSLRDELEAAGERVMTEDMLWKLTGDL